MNRFAPLVLGVALATLFFAFAALTTRADGAYGTIGDTTLEDFNAGTLFHTGLTRSVSSGGDGDGEVRLLTMGIAGKWYTETNANGLPPLFGHAAVQYNGYIYVIGGRTDIGYTSQVYYSRILTGTHDLTDWQETTPLSATTYLNGVWNHGAAVVNGRIYVLGGNKGGTLFDTVCYAPILEDGSLGTWTTTTSLPQAINFARVAVVHGRLYILGGQAPTASDKVYYARPDPTTGVITGWLTTTALLRPTFGHMVATWDDRIYVAGGKGPTYFYPYVNYAEPLSTTGEIAAGGWMTGTNLKYNLYAAAAASVNGELFATGGGKNSNTEASDYVAATLIDLYGGLGSWVDTELIKPARFYHATVASDDGWLYVIGGSSNGISPITDSRINRGATAGEGKSYAPDGEFTSRILDLGKDHVVTQLSWNAFISDTTAMTITVRYRYRPGGGTWSDWQGPYPSAAQSGLVTTTIPISITARELQYAASFSTTLITTTPVLNRVLFTYVQPRPDLRLVKDDGRVAVRLGQVITYTLYYTNTGGSTATNTWITETLPAHTTPYGTNPGWQPVGDGHYRYLVGDVASGASGQARFVVQVNAQVPEGTASIYNQALIMGQPSDDNPADNQTQLTTPLEWVDLRLALANGVTSAQPGDLLTYTVTITNAGSVPATGGVVTLTIPAHTASTGNPDWTPAGGRSYTRALDWAPGVTMLSFAVRVDDPVNPGVAELEATAAVSDDGTHGPDPTPANNTATDIDTLAWVDLIAHKTDGREVVFRKQTLVYTITITNAGNTLISGTVYLTETLPLDTTYVDQGYGWSGAGRTWTRSLAVSLPPGGSLVTHIAARTSDTAPAGPLTNTVIAWTPGCLHPALGIAYDVDTLIPLVFDPDLRLVKDDGRAVVRLGQVITYTLYYTNTGGSTATNTWITETLPAHTTPYGTNPGWQPVGDGHYRYLVGDVASGASGQARFVVQVNAQVPEGTASIYNQALIMGQPSDDNPADNQTQLTTPLEWVDLRLALANGVTSAQPGDLLTYTVTITNAGSVPATGGVVTLTIPAHTASTGNPDWTPAGGRSYTRALDWAPGVTMLSFAVRVDDPVNPGVAELEATAAVSDDGTHGPDPTPANNTATDIDTLAWVDLIAHKTDGREVVFRKQTLVYTITITNAGNTLISGTVYLTETLPLDTTYVDQGYGWSGAGRTWTRSLAVSLPPGGSLVTHIAARTSDTAPAGPLTNTVIAWTPGCLHPALGIAYDVDTLIVRVPNLIVSISDGVTTTQICQVQTYTIEYHNDGDQPATGIVLTATLPADVAYRGDGWQAIGDGRYIYPRPDLGSGESSSVTLSTVLEPPATLNRVSRGEGRLSSVDQVNRSPDDWPYQIVQSVTIGCTTLEDPVGNTDEDVNVVLRPDLYVVSVTPEPTAPRVGQDTAFRVVIGNRGSAPVASGCCNGFYVDLYVNPPHPPGAGESSNVGVYTPVSDVPAQGTVSLVLHYSFPAEGTFTVYVQANADRYREIPETDFTNNTSDAISVKVSPAGYNLYLPLIVRAF